MRLPARVHVAALGAVLDVELELADDVLRGLAAPRDSITEAELCDRWKKSPRTLKRLRDERRLPYQQPTPRTFLYKLADVEAYEREHMTQAGKLRLRGRAR